MGLLEKFAILELIGYFPYQEMLSKKIPQQKVIVWLQLPMEIVGGGSSTFLCAPPKTQHIFDVALSPSNYKNLKLTSKS